MKVVISCQQCIRQYEADSTMHGKLGRCGTCKAYFAISVAELASPGDAIAFDDPIEPRYSFLYEGVSSLARRMKDLFDLAGEPYTPESAARFAATISRLTSGVEDPGRRSGYVDELLRRAYRSCRDKAGHSRHREAVDYFIRHMAARRPDSRDMLLGAFAGVLSAEFDRVGELAIYRKPWWRFWG